MCPGAQYTGAYTDAHRGTDTYTPGNHVHPRNPEQDAPEMPSTTIGTAVCSPSRIFYSGCIHNIAGLWDISVLSQLYSVITDSL